MQDLNDLCFFAQIVDSGSFSAAARELGVPKSRISRRIAALEQRLGVQLLRRSTRRIHVTEIGQRYYEHCSAIVAEAQAAQQVIEQQQAEPSGLVRMSCPVILSQQTLAPLLPLFLARYPKVKLHLLATDRRVDLLSEGVDIALRVSHETPSQQDLVVRVLGYGGLVLVAAPALLQRLGAPQEPPQLNQYPSLGLDYADGRHQWPLHSSDGRSCVVSYQPRLMSDDLIALKQATIAGLGVCALPGSLCYHAIQRGELQTVLPNWQLPRGTLQALYPPKRGLAAGVRALIDFLAKELPQQVNQSPAWLAEDLGYNR